MSQWTTAAVVTVLQQSFFQFEGVLCLSADKMINKRDYESQIM